MQRANPQPRVGIKNHTRAINKSGIRFCVRSRAKLNKGHDRFEKPVPTFPGDTASLRVLTQFLMSALRPSRTRADDVCDH